MLRFVCGTYCSIILINTIFSFVQLELRITDHNIYTYFPFWTTFTENIVILNNFLPCQSIIELLNAKAHTKTKQPAVGCFTSWSLSLGTWNYCLLLCKVKRLKKRCVLAIRLFPWCN